MPGFLALPLFGLVLLATSHLLIRSKIASWLFFVALPLVLSGLFVWADHVDVSWFAWAKFYTLVAVMWVLLAIKDTALGERPGYKIVLWWLLALNILEAGARGAEMGNWLAGIGAVILVVTQGSRERFSLVEVDGRRELRWDIGVSWMIAYTVWNFAVVLTSVTSHALDHVVVLLTPLLLIALRRERQGWFEARATSLTAYAVMVMGIKVYAEWPWLPILAEGSTVVAAKITSWIMVGVMVPMCYWHVQARRVP